MRWLRWLAKEAIAQALYRLGLLDLLRRRRLRGRAVVLMYHRVLPEDARARSASHPGYVVSDTTFARQMAFLRSRFTVLSAHEFLSHLDTGAPFPDSSCLITFDDGWYDNLTHALPVLQAHGLPALVFLPVNFIGTRRLFWRERLTQALRAAVDRARQEPDRVAGLRALLAPHGLASLLEAAAPPPLTTFIDAVQSLAHRRMADDGALAQAIERVAGVEVEALPSPDAFLDWNDVRTMARAGIAFGGHGAEHRLLGALPPHEADEEIRQSRERVSREVGVPALALSYPNGSVTSDVRRLTEAAGYRMAFTIEPGSVAAGDDRFLLKRVNVHEDGTASMPRFLGRMVGLF